MNFQTKYGVVRVEIEGNPQDIQIEVDGESIGVQTIKNGYQIEVGPHAMSVKADGLQTQTSEFTIRDNNETVLQSDLLE